MRRAGDKHEQPQYVGCKRLAVELSAGALAGRDRFNQRRSLGRRRLKIDHDALAVEHRGRPQPDRRRRDDEVLGSASQTDEEMMIVRIDYRASARSLGLW